MIAANELRIGNWVLIDEDGKWNEYQVEGINLATRNKNIHSFTTPFIFFKIGSVVLTIDGDSEEDGMVKPIPLTTEILEKCGFVRKGHTSSNGSKLVIHHPESFTQMVGFILIHGQLKKTKFQSTSTNSKTCTSP